MLKGTRFTALRSRVRASLRLNFTGTPSTRGDAGVCWRPLGGAWDALGTFCETRGTGRLAERLRLVLTPPRRTARLSAPPTGTAGRRGCLPTSGGNWVLS